MRSCRFRFAPARPSHCRARRVRTPRAARASGECSRARRSRAATRRTRAGCRRSGLGLQLLWSFQCSSSKTSRRRGALAPIAFELVKGLNPASLWSEPHSLIAHRVLLGIAERVDLCERRSSFGVAVAKRVKARSATPLGLERSAEAVESGAFIAALGCSRKARSAHGAEQISRPTAALLGDRECRRSKHCEQDLNRPNRGCPADDQRKHRDPDATPEAL